MWYAHKSTVTFFLFFFSLFFEKNQNRFSIRPVYITISVIKKQGCGAAKRCWQQSYCFPATLCQGAASGEERRGASIRIFFRFLRFRQARDALATLFLIAFFPCLGSTSQYSFLRFGSTRWQGARNQRKEGSRDYGTFTLYLAAKSYKRASDSSLLSCHSLDPNAAYFYTLSGVCKI